MVLPPAVTSVMLFFNELLCSSLIIYLTTLGLESLPIEGKVILTVFLLQSTPTIPFSDSTKVYVGTSTTVLLYSLPFS